MSYPISLGRVMYLTAYRSDLQFQLSQVYNFIRQLASIGNRLQPQAGGTYQDTATQQLFQANQTRMAQLNKAAETESERIKALIQSVTSEMEQATQFTKKSIEEIKSLSFTS